MRIRLAVIWGCALCGCETVVDLDVPGGYEPKLIIESQFSPDSLWTMRAGKSTAFGATADPRDLIVPDARIVIFGEGRFRDTLRHVGNGIYRTTNNLRPASGYVYRVQAAAPGLPSAEARGWAPPLESEWVEMQAAANSGPTESDPYTVRLRMADLPGGNYYSLTLYQVVTVCRNARGFIRIENGPGYSSRYQVNVFRSTWPSFRSYVEAVDDPTYPDLDNTYWTAFFSDELFEATTREFTITFTPTVTEPDNQLFMLVLTALSDDLFAYERSLELHDYYLFGPSLTTTRPVTVYTNVAGGLGIFAGYTSDTYRFDLEGNPWEEKDVSFGEPGPCR